MKAIGAILSFIGWLLKRWLTKRDDPENIHKRKRSENSRIIAEHDADALNARLDDGLSGPADKGDSGGS